MALQLASHMTRDTVTLAGSKVTAPQQDFAAVAALFPSPSLPHDRLIQKIFSWAALYWKLKAGVVAGALLWEK